MKCRLFCLKKTNCYRQLLKSNTKLCNQTPIENSQKTSRMKDKNPRLQQHYKERGAVSYEKTKSTTNTDLHGTKNATSRAAINGKSVAAGIAI